VLIKFENVAVLQEARVIGGTSGSDQTLAKMRVTGPFLVESSLTALVDTASPPASLYSVDDCFASITGIGDYFYDYLLLPRSPADIVTGGTGCPAPETDCTDGIDNDHNGFVDCADFNCMSTEPSCTEATDIPSIQNGTIPLGTSVALAGKIVTAIDLDLGSSHYKYVWIEEPDGGDFSGIVVYNPTMTSGQLTDLAIGDIVDVAGVTDEFYSTTEIKAPSGGTAAVTKTGHGTVPAAFVADTAVLASPPTPLTSNPYEGLLVTVEHVSVTSTNPDSTDHYEWTVNNGVRIGSDMVDRPATLAVGQCYASITGVFFYNFNFKIEPRSAADLVTETCP